MSDIYLSLTETPSVVTLSQPVVSGVLSSNVTVSNVVSVNVVTMPAITVQAAAPAVTTVAGMVTVSNLGLVPSSVATDGTADGTLNFVKIGGHQSGSNQTAHIVHVSAGGSMSVDASGSSVTFSQASVTFGAITGSASILNFPSTQTIAGTVTANLGSPSQQELENITQEAQIISGKLNSVTIGSLPAISGTVTAYAVGKYAVAGPVFQDKNIATDVSGQTLINAIVNAQSVFSYDGTSHIFAKLTPNTTVTIGSLPAISGTVTANNPNGALTTRFGSVATANLAFITSAVTNASRKYLLAQNISAGTVTIGIGFSPTTTQGIQLPAGGGLTFDAFCPTGAVYWLGAVTGAAYTILEG